LVTRGFQVVEDLRLMLFGDCFGGFDFDDDLARNDEVGEVLANGLALEVTEIGCC
jgi:hypothetical protein